MTRRLWSVSTNQKPVLVQWTNQRADWRWPGLRTLLRDMLRLLEAAKLSRNYTPVSWGTDHQQQQLAVFQVRAPKYYKDLGLGNSLDTDHPGRAFILSARKFDQKVKNQIGTGLGHEQGHIYKRQWPMPFTYQKRAFSLAPSIYPLLWSQYPLSFLNVHWLTLWQNISNFNITKKEDSKKTKD